MLRHLAWQANDDLSRAQLGLFELLADAAGLGPDDRRRTLGLDARCWAAWMDFCSDGPLPAEPALPDMLRRLGEAAYRLSVAAQAV